MHERVRKCRDDKPSPAVPDWACRPPGARPAPQPLATNRPRADRDEPGDGRGDALPRWVLGATV